MTADMISDMTRTHCSFDVNTFENAVQLGKAQRLFPEKSSLWRREGSVSAELSLSRGQEIKSCLLVLSQSFTKREMRGDAYTHNECKDVGMKMCRGV